MSKCQNQASFRYTWPGECESTICVEHAVQLKNVANGMGLPLQLIPISYRVGESLPTEFPTCQIEGSKLAQEEGK